MMSAFINETFAIKILYTLTFIIIYEIQKCIYIFSYITIWVR